jgi:hypothetical protein
MTTLSTQLGAIKRRELSEQWDRNEAAIATSLSTVLPTKQHLDDDTKDLVRPFITYCDTAGVRYLPAKPTTVASFTFRQFDAGVTPDTIFAQLAAIEALHDSFDLANPVATSAARAALSEVSPIEAPRSWTKEEKAMFAHLPPQIRNVILRREKDRETTLRRAQGEAGELRNALKRLQAPAASTQVADNTTTESENTNG